jgi:hypothetical protein
MWGAYLCGEGLVADGLAKGDGGEGSEYFLREGRERWKGERANGLFLASEVCFEPGEEGVDLGREHA